MLLAHQKGLVHFIQETASGKTALRKRQIPQPLNSLEDGDSLLINELSRLGRSMLECMEILSIAMQNGAHIYAVKGNWQLDDTIQSKIVAMAFSMAAEIEHELISRRIKGALRAKKASGISLGRPKGPGKSKLDPFRPEIEAFIAKCYHTTAANLRNWMKKREIRREAGITSHDE